MSSHNDFLRKTDGLLNCLIDVLHTGLDKISHLLDDDLKKEVEEAKKTGDYNKLQKILEDVRSKHNKS